jgi:ribosomal protein S14
LGIKKKEQKQINRCSICGKKLKKFIKIRQE